MSMVATRSPLTVIGMNGAGPGTRRSARLSSDGQDESERPGKRQKLDAAQSAGSAKENGAGKKTRGKGKIGRFARRRCMVKHGEFDADSWAQFMTTKMVISSLRSAQSPVKSPRPRVRRSNRRPTLPNPPQSRHHAR